MSWFEAVDWGTVFVPDTPLLEILVRGSVIYLSLFFLLRVILKRQAGTVGITDLLVIVLIADAAQNGMAADYRSLPDGILLVATLIFWNYTLEWLGFRFPRVEAFIHPPPLMLVKNGRMIRRNMKKELITEDDLMCQLREQGIEHLSQVRHAFLEGNGKISILERKKSKRHPVREQAVG